MSKLATINKTTLYILLFACFSLLAFCLMSMSDVRYFAKKNITASDWLKDNLFGKVKNVQTIEYSVIFQNEEAQKEEIVTHSVKHYNREGYITENTEFYADSTMFQKEIYLYDEKRNKIEELLYDENNVLEQRTKMKYNAQKLPVSAVLEDEKGKKIQRFTYRYDERGNLTQLTGYDYRGKMAEKSYYTYNQHGSLIKHISFGLFGNQKHYYKHDANHKLTEELRTDSKDNFIEKILYQFENQYKTVKNVHVDKNDKVLSAIIYVYDDYRNLLEHTYFDENGNITERYEFAYQYDSKNNWIQQIFYSGTEKTILSITERVIEYYE